jgi:hypothetical protein
MQSYAQLASIDLNTVMEEISHSSATTVSKLNYDLYIGKGQIGKFKVSKTVRGNTVRYQAESNATIKFLGENTISYTLDCILKNDMLVWSHVKVYKNGKPKDDTVIKWTGTKYHINKSGEEIIWTEPIRKPAIALYFEEPNSDHITVFSEREAAEKSFKKQPDNNYKLTDVGKNKGDDYNYVNGSLEDVTVNYVVTNFRAIKRK